MTATVQTFRAPDSAAALAAVKRALGPDAVILGARTVEGGLFRKPEVEITAALEPPPGQMGRSEMPPVSSPSDEQPRPNRRPASRSLPPPPTDDPMAEEVRLLRRSVEEARQALATVTREARVGRELQLPPAAATVYGRMLGRGVEPVLAEELVRQAMETAAPDQLLESVKDLLGERLVPCRAPWLHEDRHVIALVGPTGVGKTTTLAKIAARAILEARKRVALVTVDIYRIGATEQLARYGEIMGVPVLVARDRGELGAALDRVKSADLVLIDTAGRSTPEDLARQAALVRTIPRVQLHLVVSAAAGAMELGAVADRYRALAPERLLLSKIDEAAGPGGILSAAVRVGRPIACVANGQRVPEDLHALTGPQLVDLVIGQRENPLG